MNVKNLVLGVGIFIIYMLLLIQGIEAFYPSPEYEDYCDFDTKPVMVPDNNTRDLEGAGGNCEDYESARDGYTQNLFFIALAVGIVTLVIGYFVLSVEPVGSALIASGIGAIFYGSAENWRNFGDYWRFILLAVALVFLVWLALRLNKKRK